MYSTHDGTNILAINARGPMEVEHERSALVHGEDEDLYKMHNGGLVSRDASEIAQILADRQAAADAAEQAKQDLEDEYTGTGFATITVAQADAYVDSELPANVTDVTTARQAILGLRDICNKQNRMLIWMREEIKKRL